MTQSSLVSRSSRNVLRVVPTLLYVSALVATVVFAFTHASLAWQVALYACLAGVLVAIPASLLDSRDLDAIAAWDTERGATLSCVVLGLGAMTLAALNVLMQRSAYGIALPPIPMMQGKPDVLVAALLLGGAVGLSIASSVVGRALVRNRAIRLRAADPRILGPATLAPVPARRPRT